MPVIHVKKIFAFETSFDRKEKVFVLKSGRYFDVERAQFV